MDNRGKRNNYTLKLFDRAYEKLDRVPNLIVLKELFDYGTSMFPSYNSSDLEQLKTPILVIVAEKITELNLSIPSKCQN